MKKFGKRTATDLQDKNNSGSPKKQKLFAEIKEEEKKDPKVESDSEQDKKESEKNESEGKKPEQMMKLPELEKKEPVIFNFGVIKKEELIKEDVAKSLEIEK
jgi:fructose-1,6-bisphosphatase/sedoheptulose 1,7-bisphosphatase-like protein